MIRKYGKREEGRGERKREEKRKKKNKCDIKEKLETRRFYKNVPSSRMPDRFNRCMFDPISKNFPLK